MFFSVEDNIISLFTSLSFNNQFIKALPADVDETNQPRQVHNAAYSWVKPTSVVKPKLIAVSQNVAGILGFLPSELTHYEFAEVFTGNKLLAGMQPFAMCYGGHQFGHWAGQLGDGRAINLGEVQTKNHGLQMLQLKGAGRTPYSRTADGLAVLRSSIREFLCSEAMYHLGIPTTRALSLCLTGEQVTRDMFYDGYPKLELGAVVCRVSSSFLRFGSFQLPAARKDLSLLKQLVDYAIRTDFSRLLDENSGVYDANLYLKWFAEVSERTCSLIVHWLRVGFVHGVMNTDNMSIIGETIDYGPYGWIDNFDIHWTPNTTDAQGKRYCFGAQAEIGQWNLFQLANAIFPLINDAEPLNEILNEYAENYQRQWCLMMAKKLGFAHYQGESDQQLFVDLEVLLSSIETDMTVFYRQLAKFEIKKAPVQEQDWLPILTPAIYNSAVLSLTLKEQWSQWFTRYGERCQQDEHSTVDRITRMNNTNPKFVLRNYLVQQAIEAAEQGDYSEIEKLQKILQNPYDEQEHYQAYAQKRPEWARNKAGCSALSCSS